MVVNYRAEYPLKAYRQKKPVLFGNYLAKYQVFYLGFFSVISAKVFRRYFWLGIEILVMLFVFDKCQPLSSKHLTYCAFKIVLLV